HRYHALQCGFCTPGMIMAAVDLIETYPGPLSEAVVREEMEGNLCRCTGYHNIVKAILAAAGIMRAAQTAAEEWDGGVSDEISPSARPRRGRAAFQRVRGCSLSGGRTHVAADAQAAAGTPVRSHRSVRSPGTRGHQPAGGGHSDRGDHKARRGCRVADRA